MAEYLRDHPWVPVYKEFVQQKSAVRFSTCSQDRQKHRHTDKMKVYIGLLLTALVRSIFCLYGCSMYTWIAASLCLIDLFFGVQRVVYENRKV